MSPSDKGNRSDNGDDYEVEEIEVEEEVDASDDDAQSEAPSSPAKVDVPSSSKGKAVASSSTPGKVKPSKEVRDMVISTPEQKRKGNVPDDRNPFPLYGGWTESELSDVTIEFPILTGKNESTNDLTRATKPEMRYWKAPILFKKNNYVSQTIRFDNVHIPYYQGKGYGSNYVYLCLPGFVAEAFSVAGKSLYPVRVTEASLKPDKERFWKIANNVEGSFGIINESTKKFHSKSLETIFEATNAGITASVVLKFMCKASTTEREALKGTTIRTMAVEVVRGFISGVDVNVQMPVKVSKEKAKVEPVASKKDVATDSLMKRLSEMGI